VIPFERFISIFTAADGSEYVVLRGTHNSKTSRGFLIAQEEWSTFPERALKEFTPAAGKPMPDSAVELLEYFKRQVYNCISAKQKEMEAALTKFDSKTVAARRLTELQHEQHQNSGKTQVAGLQEENKVQQVKIGNLEGALASAKKRIKTVEEGYRGEIAELQENLEIARSKEKIAWSELHAYLKKENERLLAQRDQE